MMTGFISFAIGSISPQAKGWVLQCFDKCLVAVWAHSNIKNSCGFCLLRSDLAVWENNVPKWSAVAREVMLDEEVRHHYLSSIVVFLLMGVQWHLLSKLFNVFMWMSEWTRPSNPGGYRQCFYCTECKGASCYHEQQCSIVLPRATAQIGRLCAHIELLEHRYLPGHHISMSL